MYVVWMTGECNGGGQKPLEAEGFVDVESTSAGDDPEAMFAGM
jgi:hypothetical protein